MDLGRFPSGVAAVNKAAEMYEHQQPDSRLLREPSGLDSRHRPALHSDVMALFNVGRHRHEQSGVYCVGNRGGRGAAGAEDAKLSPATSRPHDLVGMDSAHNVAAL